MEIGYAEPDTSLRIAVLSTIKFRTTERVSRENHDHTPISTEHGAND
tara:strand:+ start:660 stop:800 length:141 start_codon:yes stop_codon:yes gene_type:complete